MNNIIGTYINSTEKRFKKYCNLILKSRYDKNIVEELIKTYNDARYYNYDVDYSIKIFYRRIYAALVKKSKELIEKQPKDKLKIESTLILFQYFFYFDYVREKSDLNEIVELIAEKRITRFRLRLSESDIFVKEFTDMITDDMKKNEYLFNLYDTNDFQLKFNKISSRKKEFYYVNLLYKFKFPKEYSKQAIDEVFNTNIVSEDRLFVEYPMLANTALKDIFKAEFDKIYIADFAVTLLKKNKKLEQLLEIFNDQASQDKIYFKIEYNDFLENKDRICELIKRGFRFALRTNYNMPKLTSNQLKILEVFDCIISNENDINKKSYKKDKLLLETY